MLALTFSCTACGGSGSTGSFAPTVGALDAQRTDFSIASVASTATAAPVPFPPTPDSDPFYAQPSPFPKLAPGTILASRSVTYAPVGGVAMSNAAWELKFVSRDSRNRDIAAVATVVKPTTPVASGPEPLLSVQYAEDGLGSQCAPSHAVTGSTADSNEQLEAAFPQLGLKQGWTLVYPDFEGPESAYASSRIGGQITLDGIKAAESFAPLGLSVKTPVGLTGYSGGATATAWAATLERTYAPALDIVAIASGGTPADYEQILSNIDTNVLSNTAFFAEILSAVVGVNRSYPALFTPVANAKGVAAATSLANGCVGNTSNGAAAPTGQLTDYATKNFFTPPDDHVLPINDLPQSGSSPVANTFVYHSQVDELIPIAGTDAMVAAWCADGAPIQYYRGVSGDHVAFEPAMVASVYAYLTSRFAGTPTVLPPGTTTCT